MLSARAARYTGITGSRHWESPFQRDRPASILLAILWSSAIVWQRVDPRGSIHGSKAPPLWFQRQPKCVLQISPTDDICRLMDYCMVVPCSLVLDFDHGRGLQILERMWIAPPPPTSPSLASHAPGTPVAIRINLAEPTRDGHCRAATDSLSPRHGRGGLFYNYHGSRMEN